MNLKEYSSLGFLTVTLGLAGLSLVHRGCQEIRTRYNSPNIEDTIYNSKLEKINLEKESRKVILPRYIEIEGKSYDSDLFLDPRSPMRII